MFVVKLLGDQQSLLVSAAIKGLSLIGSVAPLGLPNGSSTTKDEKMDVDGEFFLFKKYNDLFNSIFADASPAPSTKTSVSDTVFRLLKSAHTKAKTREEAAICLGYLAIGDGAFFVESNLKQFRTLLKLSKDTALNIAIAQGIVYTILGREDLQPAAEDEVNPHCGDALLTDFLNAIIRAVPDPHPCSRNASSIWLLALVKNLAKRPSVYQHKQLLQWAFTELLSDDSGKL